MKSSASDSPDLKRRRLIRDAGIGVGGVLAVGGSGVLAASTETTSDTSACKAPGCDYDVIVVGGGFAGVTASRDCRKNGYRTLLLEAHNRLGGRSFTTDFEGTMVELGGFWIHHTQPFVWAETERYALEIVETPGAVPDVMTMHTGDELINLTLEQLYEAVGGWQAYTETGREILPRAWDVLHNREAALQADSINAVAAMDSMELSDFQKYFNKVTIVALAHNRPEAMSYLEVLRWHQCGGGFYPTFIDSIARFSLKDGTAALIQKMIADGQPDVRLSTAVKSIEDKGDHVVVTSVSGEKFTAGAVISSLPMNTVANVAFDPPLPAGVIEAGKERHNGVGFKLYMKVKGDVGNRVSIGMTKPLENVITYKQAGDYTILIGFGGSTEALDVYDDEAVQKALREHIPDAELISSISYDWNNDPYARGTWCTYKPGWVAKYYEDFNKDLGRIYFGPGDHGEGWRGFIDGAIGSGIKAAERVKQLLG